MSESGVIEFTCPHCQAKLRAKDSNYGKLIACSSCEKDVRIDPLNSVPTEEDLHPGQKKCPACDKWIKSAEPECLRCGFEYESGPSTKLMFIPLLFAAVAAIPGIAVVIAGGGGTGATAIGIAMLIAIPVIAYHFARIVIVGSKKIDDPKEN
jgi:uncharacterized paraquat-inducible protein A